MTTIFNLAWLKRTNGRQLAYRECFHHEGKLTKAGETVLRDMSEFCSFAEPTTVLDSTGRVDPLAMANKEGRREAFLHLLSMLDSGTFTDIQRRLSEAEQQEAY